MIRVILCMSVGTKTVSCVGAQVRTRGTELFVDRKRFARWHHPDAVWLDEHGRRWDYVEFQSAG